MNVATLLGRGERRPGARELRSATQTRLIGPTAGLP